MSREVVLDAEYLRKWAEELHKKEQFLIRKEQDLLQASMTRGVDNMIVSSSSSSSLSPSPSRNATMGHRPPSSPPSPKMAASKKPQGGTRLPSMTSTGANRPVSPNSASAISAPMFNLAPFNSGNMSVNNNNNNNNNNTIAIRSNKKSDSAFHMSDDEVKKAFLAALSDKQLAAVQLAFNRVDKDHNGVIDSYEMYDALRVLYGDISLPEANKFYMTIDSNGSGFVTFDEFLSATVTYQWDTSLLQSNLSSTIAKPLRDPDHEWEIPYEELVIETKLGEGTYGVVYKGKWRHTTVAIKELKVPASEMKDKLLNDFRNEISIMGRLRHPNVLLYMGACTKDHFCIVTELLPGGSIYDVLHARKARFDTKLALYFAKQTAMAMTYLHMSSPQIVHRDLKTENLLLDNHFNVKVCDFGLSCVKPTNENLKEQVGSPLWMAPEVLAGGSYDERCDVYSFALILWEFFANALPYSQCEEFHHLVNMVVHQRSRPPMPPHTPPDVAALIQCCWDPDPAKRPNFAQIVETIQEIARNLKSEGRF